MAKSVKSIAVVPLPPVEVITLHDPAEELNTEPRNARFVLTPVDLAGIGTDGKATKYFWRSPVTDRDLIHCHRGDDGKLYATDGNRRVHTLRRLKAENPVAYATMLADLTERDGGFRVAVYKGTLTENQILWALRDVDQSQAEWTDGEKMRHYFALRDSGATVTQAASFFGFTGARWPDAERLYNLPRDVSDLWIDTRLDSALAKADANHVRKYSQEVTGPQISELNKAVSEFQKANPGATGTGPEFAAKLAEIRTKVETPKGEGPSYSPPRVPEAHRKSLQGSIETLVKKGETLAARALAVGLGLELTGDDKVTRVLADGDVTKFVADVSAIA